MTFFTICLTSLLWSCGDQKNTDDSIYETVETSTQIQESTQDEKQESVMNPRSIGGEKDANQVFIDEVNSENISDSYLGSYVGDFGKNMINITLYKMENGEAEGYSVCAGNFRKIVGTYKKVDDVTFSFKLDEPGDDKYDGSFEFDLSSDINEINGKWTPFKTEGNSAKDYNLHKRQYVYYPNLGDYPEASTRLLTEEDVNNLDADELAYMRNTIYARRGYSFKDKDWRYTFEQKDWYMPTCVDVRDKLTDIEVANIELIYDYEAYYEMSYDDFGR